MLCRQSARYIWSHLIEYVQLFTINIRWKKYDNQK